MTTSAGTSVEVGLPAGGADAVSGREAIVISVGRAIGAVFTGTFRTVGRTLVGLAPSSWLLVDLLILCGSLCLAFNIIAHYDAAVPHLALWQSIFVFSFAMTGSNMILGLYERETIAGRARILTRTWMTAAATAAISYAMIYAVMYATVSRRVAATALVVFCLVSAALRFWACWGLNSSRRNLLIAGPRSLFDSFERAKSDGLLAEYRLLGFADTGAMRSSTEASAMRWGDLRGDLDRIRQEKISDIVVSAEAARDPQARSWMLPCLQMGCRVTNEATFYEKATGQILVDEITPDWFLFADLKTHCDEQATLKRVVDLATAMLGLVISAPLWPLIALAIKLDDEGPVFYSQTRIGQNGSVFRLFKFRTMNVDAENGKSQWASTNDPRVTRVGKWLRKLRLDELPQLYNVLIGEMSIVGPRPERPDIVGELSNVIPFYAERHLVKPGITGWAQISFRYGASIDDSKRKLRFDLYYLKHMSFELDMIIIFRTLGSFIRGSC